MIERSVPDGEAKILDMSSLFERSLVVIPAFNEEGAVSDVVKAVSEAVPGIACIVVDDGSSDLTADRAREAGATVVSLPFNLGVGGAMRTGFRYAHSHGYDNVVQVDADGQHDPRYIPALLGALSSADIVVGSRFHRDSDYLVAGPRKWAMMFLSYALTRITGTALSDTTSGFKACGPRAVAVFVRNYPAEYLGDTVEALVIAHRAGCTIAEQPVAMAPRIAGRPSHRPLRAAAYLARACMALAFVVGRGAAALE